MTSQHTAAPARGGGQPGGHHAATDADTARTRAAVRCGRASGHASGSSSGPAAADWPSNWPRPADPDADTIADTLGWIEVKATAATASASGPVPELGTAAWCALADNDPARWAAVCLAAAAWFRQYVTIGDRIRTEAREELARFEDFAGERERIEADAARTARRQVVKELCAAVDRRERAARTDLLDRTGPELIAAAHASWGLAPPASASVSPSAIRRAA